MADERQEVTVRALARWLIVVALVLAGVVLFRRRAGGQPDRAVGDGGERPVSLIRLTLPDGSVREVPSGTTGRALAESIGPGLAKAALAIRVDGPIRDLGRPIEADTKAAILTDKDPDALEVLRHSSAHILATAVREIFPGAGIGFGPPIEDGFYYDFEVPRPFTPE